MPDFYHASTCRCGNCRPEPVEGPTHAQMACSCFFNDGDMQFCDQHDPHNDEPLPTAESQASA